MEFATFLRFIRLVSDSTDPATVFSLLAKTVVEECQVLHAVVFGVEESGDFKPVASYGIATATLDPIQSAAGIGESELSAVVLKACARPDAESRAFPLISDTGLFGALVVLFPRDCPLEERERTLIEGLAELTAISLNKAFQHRKLQKAFDDLRLSQETLIRTERLRALGEMSAGISHDLRNLLNPLMVYAELIRDSSRNPDEVMEISERVGRILTRGLETVERLKDFGRQSSEETGAAPSNLSALAREAIAICKPRLGGIRLVLDLADRPVAAVREADCVTAIVNLLFNAADALQETGVITVVTGVSDASVWIEVRDNGPGMTADVLERILEPFFTTKGNQGTGLGIPTVYAFTQRHGGTLDIESEPGRGARFRMSFPAVGRDRAPAG